MIYNFDTSDENAATAAFLVYAVYRSRDMKRFKVTPSMWDTIERAVKSVAKRAEDMAEFIEKLKPKLACASIKPKWAKTIPDGMISMIQGPSGELMQIGQDQEKRQFMTDLLDEADDRAVLDVLYRKAAYVVLLVRDRLERERPYEAQFKEVEFKTVEVPENYSEDDDEGDDGEGAGRFKHPYFITAHAVQRFQERVAQINSARVIEVVQEALQNPGPPIEMERRPDGQMVPIFRCEHEGIPYYVPVVKGEGEWPAVPTIHGPESMIHERIQNGEKKGCGIYEKGKRG